MLVHILILEKQNVFFPETKLFVQTASPADRRPHSNQYDLKSSHVERREGKSQLEPVCWLGNHQICLATVQIHYAPDKWCCMAKSKAN